MILSHTSLQQLGTASNQDKACRRTAVHDTKPEICTQKCRKRQQMQFGHLGHDGHLNLRNDCTPGPCSVVLLPALNQAPSSATIFLSKAYDFQHEFDSWLVGWLFWV